MGSADWLKVFAAWLCVVGLAVANGALREAALIPWLGARAGLVSSGVLLCLLILLVAYGLARLVRGFAVSQGLRAGALWLLLTLAFEFGFGRYVQGKPWSALLEAYTFEGGNLWPVVLAVTFLAPPLAALSRSSRRSA